MTLAAIEQVQYGRSLLNPSNGCLRAKIEELALSAGLTSLYADTVLGLYSSGALTIANQHRSVLLFDHFRCYWYDKLPSRPGIHSVLQFLVDYYPGQPFSSFLEHDQRQPYRFLFDPAALDIFKTIRAHHPDTVLVALDLLTSEISVPPVHFHPAAQRFAVDSGNAARSAAGPLEHLPLQNRVAGAGLRCRPVPSLEGLVSPHSGVIRQESIAFRNAPIPGATARVVAANGAADIVCGGKSLRLDEARRIARCEAAERFHTFFSDPEERFEYGSYADLQASAVDPEALLFRIHRATPAAASWPTYSPTAPMYWTWASDPLLRKQTLVPAQEVWFTNFLPGEIQFFWNTTTGCALGSCFEEAALFGLFEAVERDAYLAMWYLRRPCDTIDPESVPFEPFQLLWARARSLFPHYGVHFFDTATDLRLPTVAAIAVREAGTGPRTVHASATRYDIGRAMAAALADLLPEMAKFTFRERRELLANPDAVALPEDHRDLYSLDETFDRFSFLDFSAKPTLTARDVNARGGVVIREQYDLGATLEEILVQFDRLGLRVLFKDMTHSNFAARGLVCVKAITPGLLPMWFGSGNRRVALTERLRRLGERFCGGTITTESDLNLEIHPFS
jgi:thiazole/oxazole-forming peptide maturase SagD family component